MKRTLAVVLGFAVVVGAWVSVKRYAEAEAAAAVAAFKRQQFDSALAAWDSTRAELVHELATVRFNADSLQLVLDVQHAALEEASRQNAALQGDLDRAIAAAPDSLAPAIRLGVAGLREEVRLCRNALSICEQRAQTLEDALTLSQRIASRERVLHDSTRLLLRAADDELARRTRGGVAPIKLGLLGGGAALTGYGIGHEDATVGLIGLAVLALGLIW